MFGLNCADAQPSPGVQVPHVWLQLPDSARQLPHMPTQPPNPEMQLPHAPMQMCNPSHIAGPLTSVFSPFEVVTSEWVLFCGWAWGAAPDVRE